MATNNEVKIFEEQETIINEHHKKFSRLQTKLNRDYGLKNIRQESANLS
jgi:hypothetical protein